MKIITVNMCRQFLGINFVQILRKWLFFAFIMKLNHRILKLTAKIMTERRKVERKKKRGVRRNEKSKKKYVEVIS